MHERRIGEVVETSTVQFVVECDELDRFPELGSFVRVGGTDVEAIYGIVAYAKTTAVDPGRRVVRRGSGGIQDRALYEANPELRFVLRSLFVAVAIAHERSGRLFFLLPPCPPPLHYSVERVPAEEIWRLTDSGRYFSFLLAMHGEVPVDQLLAAHLSYVFRARGNDERWLEGAAQELARLLKRDYDRLRQVLEAVEPLIEPRPH